jgi:hypothetical protein
LRQAAQPRNQHPTIAGNAACALVDLPITFSGEVERHIPDDNHRLLHQHVEHVALRCAWFSIPAALDLLQLRLAINLGPDGNRGQGATTGTYSGPIGLVATGREVVGELAQAVE